MLYYAVRNLKSNLICVTNKKPKWGFYNIRNKKEWLFIERKSNPFWKIVHRDVFKKLTGIKPPKEGKDGIIIIPKEKMKLIKLL